MKRLWGILLVTALVAGVIGGASYARAQTTYANLEIIIALDVSGSMTLDDVRQSPGERPPGDVGYALLPLKTPATDRNGERFNISYSLVQWLVRQLQSRPELSDALQVHANVVGFDQTVYNVLDWTLLNTTSLSSLPEFQPPDQTPDEAHNSDFIGLYEQVNHEFTSHDINGTTRRVLIVVTDSLPCKPEGEYGPQFINGLQVHNWDCRRPNVMTNHIQYAHTQLLSPDVVPIVLHISNNDLWDSEVSGESLANIRLEWRNSTLRRDGEFLQLDSIDQLSQAMFDVLAEQLTLAIAGGNSADQAQVGHTLGLVASTGSLEVPPYQEHLEMLVLSQAATMPVIKANGDTISADETLFASNSGQMRYLRFDRPPAGNWTVQDSSGSPVTIRVMYRPAQASLAWITPDPSGLQYQPVQLVYTIHDENDVSWIEPDYTPQVIASIHSPRGADIDLEMTCDTTQCVSESFLPLDVGPYAVSFEVKPETNWPEITVPVALAEEEVENEGENGEESAAATTELPLVDQYAFLKPDLPRPLQVDALHFWRQIGDRLPASDANPESSVQLTQPRSNLLSLKVWAGTADEAVELPPGLSVDIFYGDGVGCPPESERVTRLRQEDRYLLARPELQFETGDCSISMSLSMKSSLKPIGDGATFDLGNFALADITSTSTARLSLVLLNAEGEPQNISLSSGNNTTSDTGSPRYSMYDYTSVPEFNTSDWVIWPRDTRSIEIAFRDEEGRLTHPQFIGETTVSAESVGVGNPIPFRFSIVRADGMGNLAEELGIELHKSEKEGVYVAEISGLDPGDYLVQFELLLNDPDAPQLDTARFEYDPSLTQQSGNPVAVASLRVDSNPLRLAEIYGAAGLAGLLGLVVARAGVLRYLRTTAPLAGTLAIYMRSKWNDAEEAPERVWAVELPANVNSYQVPRGKLLDSPALTLAQFNRVQVETHRSKAISRSGGAYATITVGAQVYPLELKPGDPKYFHTDEQGAKFYAVKFASGVEQQLPAEKFKD